MLRHRFSNKQWGPEQPSSLLQIVCDVRSTEYTIQFIFDETEKDIRFIRWSRGS